MLAEADDVARAGDVEASGGRSERRDRRDVPFVTIDPAPSLDLDQAYAAERRGGGFRLYYAIADVAAFVRPGGALDDETRRRGVTLYSPDVRTPLHPDVLAEGAASLLPDVDRPALVWEFDLDGDGSPTATRLEPAIVRSRAKLSYEDVQKAIDVGTADASLQLLRTVGQLRQAQEVARGGVSLNLPSQEIEEVDGRFDLVYEATLPVEEWNAQISLLTGMEAARIMLDGGIGVLRTLPPPDDYTVSAIHRSARKLGHPWPGEMSYAEFVRSVDRADSKCAALLHQAARALGGSGYRAFDKATTPSKHDRMHSAVAAPYAHVTAPLRRLVDRFANEVVLALIAGREVPDWAFAALPDLPDTMQRTRGLENQLGHAMLDFAEAMVLRSRIGEVFEAAITNIDKRGAVIQLDDPAVLARMPAGGAELGADVEVRLVEADPELRRLVFKRA